MGYNNISYVSIQRIINLVDRKNSMKSFKWVKFKENDLVALPPIYPSQIFWLMCKIKILISPASWLDFETQFVCTIKPQGDFIMEKSSQW